MPQLELEDILPAALKTARQFFPRASQTTPSIIRVRHAVERDVLGDAVISVWVILAENTSPALLRHAQFQPFADRVREAVRLALRPYNVDVLHHVRFLLESEEAGL